MIEMKLAQVKELFFDRALVQKKAEQGMVRAFSRIGAFVRARARSSIRKRKGISEPGNPPSSHTGLLKDNIFFAFQDRPVGVVIGPILLNGKAGPEILRLLEEGGETFRRKLFFYDDAGNPHPLPSPIMERLFYRARPFMQPALAAEITAGTIDKALANCVHT